MDIYFYEVNFLDVSREILKFYQYSICIFCKFYKKKLKVLEKLIFLSMLMICFYVFGILSIEGVQSFGFVLNLEVFFFVGGDFIVSVDGYRFVKSVRWYRRFLRGIVDIKQYFINLAVYRFEK